MSSEPEFNAFVGYSRIAKLTCDDCGHELEAMLVVAQMPTDEEFSQKFLEMASETRGWGRVGTKDFCRCCLAKRAAMN